MKRTLGLCFICFLISLIAKSQLPVKFDNQYKKIFAKDLCLLAEKNPNLVIIDVRSPGEYNDTSRYNSLNMGHVKSAINIPIDSIQKNVGIMSVYKNKTFVVYCSHSQRSRRVSKILSDNGFTGFYNLNGGMTQLNQMTEQEFPCKKDWLVTTLKYKNLSSSGAIKLIQENPQLIILDIRPETMFNSTDSLVENNIGRIKKAINIPYADLNQRMNELENFKNRPILVYSQSGDGDAARTALELANKGFTNVCHLLAGLNALLINEDSKSIIENDALYHIVDGPGALRLLKNSKQITIYDTRPKNEFENRMGENESYKNLGNIKNAVNIVEKDFSSIVYPKNKDNPVLIYGREEAAKLAVILSNQGYTGVYVMYGLFDFVFSAFNSDGCSDALQFLENHKGLY